MASFDKMGPWMKYAISDMSGGEKTKLLTFSRMLSDMEYLHDDDGRLSKSCEDMT